MRFDSYVDFENEFRGDTESILSQFSKYDALINLIIKDIDNPILVDIGSGRGEWLQKWSNKIDDCSGIENDPDMIAICREKDLNIIDGDALTILQTLPSNSVSILSMFHMIEHVDHEKSKIILSECCRVLSDEGIFIIETPSIDNLIVSTNTFYLDQTHISHINPDALKFSMKTIGFKEVNDFYINGGPMKNEKHSKLTRIMNGVAQDLLIVATKSFSKSKLIFFDDVTWQKNLNQAPKTMEACVQFDLLNEKVISDNQKVISDNQKIILDNQSEITDLKNLLKDQFKAFEELNNQVNILKYDLKFILIFYKILRKLLYPFYNFFKRINTYILLLFSKIFNKIINNNILKKIIFSKKMLNFLSRLLDKLSFSTYSKYLKKNQANIERYKILDKTSFNFNKFLLSNHQRSRRSQSIAKSLNKKITDK